MPSPLCAPNSSIFIEHPVIRLIPRRDSRISAPSNIKQLLSHNCHLPKSLMFSVEMEITQDSSMGYFVELYKCGERL